MTTQKFIHDVNAQVTKGIQSVEHDYTAQAASTTPLHFEDILGQSDAPYWWRLYINPKDWEAALKLAPADYPGEFYNKDKNVNEANQPKGFREGMVKGYTKYLKTRELDSHLKTSGSFLTADDYEKIFQTCTPLKLAGQADNIKPWAGGLREIAKDDPSFPGPEKLAADLHEEKFSITDSSETKDWALVLKFPTADKAFAYHVPGMGNRMTTASRGATLKAGINSVFHKLQTEIGHATKKSQQLHAIARAIRSLHIMHAFPNGCGRTNVFTLLPLLLLHYGFGLPLGGEHGGAVDKNAIDVMFNGGFTVDEIARFLFVMQDFGLIGLSHEGKLAKKSCLGAHGEKPLAH